MPMFGSENVSATALSDGRSLLDIAFVTGMTLSSSTANYQGIPLTLYEDGKGNYFLAVVVDGDATLGSNTVYYKNTAYAVSESGHKRYLTINDAGSGFSVESTTSWRGMPLGLGANNTLLAVSSTVTSDEEALVAIGGVLMNVRRGGDRWYLVVGSYSDMTDASSESSSNSDTSSHSSQSSSNSSKSSRSSQSSSASSHSSHSHSSSSSDGCGGSYGCTDPAAGNYDDRALCDDGTCQYYMDIGDAPLAVNDTPHPTLYIYFDGTYNISSDGSVPEGMQIVRYGDNALATILSCFVGEDNSTLVLEMQEAWLCSDTWRLVFNGVQSPGLYIADGGYFASLNVNISPYVACTALGDPYYDPTAVCNDPYGCYF